MRKLLLILLLISVGFTTLAPEVHAIGHEEAVAGFLTDLKEKIGGAVGGAAGAIGGQLASFARLVSDKLLDVSKLFFTFVLYRANQEVEFFGNSFVQAGWAAIRDIANAFFILLLVFMALATILGIPQYGVKNRIVPLIITALLMNFSLFFTGFIVNLSQIIMSFFVNALSDQIKDIGQQFVQTGLNMQDTKAAGILMQNPAVSDVFVAIFQFATAFVLLYIALMLIIRIVALWIAMILSPLAFIARIIPRLEGYFNTWLNGFLNWTFFGVFSLFFIWLATYLFQYMNIELKDAFGTDALPSTDSATDSTAFLENMRIVFQFLVVLIFLIKSVTVAKGMAGTAASFAAGTVSLGLSGALFAGGAAGGAARLARLRAGRGIQESAGARGVAGRIGGALATAPILSRIPGASRLGQRMAELGAGVPLREQAAQAGKELTAANIVPRLRTANRELPQARKLALVQKAIELKQTNAIPPWLMEEAAAITGNIGDTPMLNSIRRAMPHRALPLSDEMKNRLSIPTGRAAELTQTTRMVRSSDLETMDRDALISDEGREFREQAVKVWTPEHYRKLAQMGDIAVIEAMQRAIDAVPENDIPEATKRYLSNTLTADVWNTKFARGGPPPPPTGPTAGGPTSPGGPPPVPPQPQERRGGYSQEDRERLRQTRGSQQAPQPQKPPPPPNETDEERLKRLRDEFYG